MASPGLVLYLRDDEAQNSESSLCLYSQLEAKVLPRLCG